MYIYICMFTYISLFIVGVTHDYCDSSIDIGWFDFVLFWET